jgi:hypothetical protein
LKAWYRNRSRRSWCADMKSNRILAVLMAFTGLYLAFCSIKYMAWADDEVTKFGKQIDANDVQENDVYELVTINRSK